MPAQRERILVASRQVADAEHADQRFQLVGQRHHGADQPLRQLVAGEARLVVVFDGEGHVFGQAVVAGVVAAHDALQLGELAHHVGQQVGLGQLGGQIGALHQRLAAGQRVGGGDLPGDGARDGAHALHALALRAQLVVVHDLGQALHTAFQRLLAVLVEEELGVGQARAHHALVAADHRAGVGRRDVAHHQEAVGQPALRVQQREVLLVGLHGQDQAFLRHAQELLVEAADQHVGALDQGCDLVQKRFVFDSTQAFTRIGRGLVELGGDVGAALLEAGDHGAMQPELGGVAVGRGQLDRVHGRLEAVAVRGTAGREAQRRHRHDLLAVQRHQAVRRAHELHAVPARQRGAGAELVGHDLGDGQLGDGGFQRRLQAVGQRRAGLHAVEEQCLALAIGGAHELRYHGRIGAQRLQFLEQRRCGLALRVQRHLHRHQLGAHRLVGRLGSHVGDVRRQPARAGEVRGLAGVGQQALALEFLGEGAGKGCAQALQGLGRQFLDEEFDQKVVRCHGARSLTRPSSRSAPPIRAAPWGSPAARGCRNSSAPRRAPGCGYGRCRRRARSR